MEEAAIKAISNNPAALDDIRLAYRLHVLSSEKLITWRALSRSRLYRELFHFKPRFIQALALATAVYPAAKVEVLEQGVVLKAFTPAGRPPIYALR